jgi:cytochrome c-type biogenesis protein CcmH/NrfG
MAVKLSDSLAEQAIITMHVNYNNPEAVKLAIQAVRLDRNNVHALVVLGTCYTALKRYAAAKRHFVKATKLQENNIEAWRGLACTYTHLKDDLAAKQARQKVHTLEAQQNNKQKSLAFVSFKVLEEQDICLAFAKFAKNDLIARADLTTHCVKNEHYMTAYRERKNLPLIKQVNRNI